ncbi:hypothetical protein TWF106_004749 [Orbilia oligospora]|uniref:RNase III domain-containing protein n=1 Tax=Orbilia oligospora TaxID=2813651 RepID=A0A6G1M1E9_ORBOL|nr:hypothetical protein TWF788_001834 [Orbilia oligospora]KAF3198185.1 hypothetical protein TWF106_004749 [Orbilia oligospora]KAF3222736.1 hypothetical protein TWF191_006556 [Orbilia oligospora]KAF3242006.1 hypothetical protein TWF192_008780 [Orbilia oligospora]
MQRLLYNTFKQILKTNKSAPNTYISGCGLKSQASQFSSQVGAKAVGLPMFEYPPGANIPIPPSIKSPELQRLLQQGVTRQEIKTEFGTLSLKKLEQVGDVKYNAAIVQHLIKKHPQIEWPEMMYLCNILRSNAQLNAFAKGLRTVDRIHARNVTGVKAVADVQEAEFGAMTFEKGRDKTTKYIQTLIEPAIRFHREVYKAHN